MTPMRSDSFKPAALMLMACLLLLHAGAPSVAAAPGGAGSSAIATLAFCEQLEPVIEAVTDGKPGRVPAAAERANDWWRAHGADSLYAVPMASLRVAAASHRAPRAAAVAVKASTLALDRCTEPNADGVRIMRIDLAGMAAWLHSKGLACEMPAGAAAAAHRIAQRLRTGGHVRLADQLEAETAAALVIPVRVNGATSAATALLERVDEVEQAFRKR